MSEQVFNFDAEQWKNLKELTKKNAGTRSVTFCTDFSFCQNQTTYSRSVVNKDAPATCSRTSPHTNTSSTYSRSTPLQASRTKYSRTRHSRDRIGDSRADYRQYSRTSHSDTGYNRYSRHSYYDNYVPYSQYTQYTQYNQVSVCADTYTYNRVSRYTASNALTTNLPSVPVLLGTENGHIPVLGKTVKIGLYAYDRDTTSAMQKVYFDVYIQQIKDKYGVRVTGKPLTKIKSNVAESTLGEGLIFDFDTTAYTEGYYRIIAVARNAPLTKTFSVSGDASKSSVSATYYMQDIATDSITKSGEYDGVSLISGLTFGRGETNDPAKNANSKDITTGYIYDMYSISEVRIRQNQLAYFNAGLKNETTKLNMMFAGLESDIVKSNETRGAYNAATKVLKVYGSNDIADGDSYITLRGWNKGVVANIAVVENDTDQWVEVIGELVNKTTGAVMPNSRIVAQFPTDKTKKDKYVTVIKGGGAGVQMEGYLYWSAGLFKKAISSMKMEEYYVRLTVNEYTDAAKASVMKSSTYSAASVTADGKASSAALGFNVDVYEPTVTSTVKKPASGSWISSLSVPVNVSDDRSGTGVLSTSSKLREVYIRLKDKNGKVIKEYPFTTANGKLSQNLLKVDKTVSFALANGAYNTGMYVEVVARDSVGNTTTKTVASGLNFDSTAAWVKVDKQPNADGSWFQKPVAPVLTVGKENGKPIERIQILESTSATAPALTDKNWVVVDNPGTRFEYATTKLGQTTGQHYLHVYVDDGLHEPIAQTFGPYKVDLESPDVEVACDAIRAWKHQTTVVADMTESAVGSGLASATITWYRSNGSVGGTVSKTYGETIKDATLSLDISIPDNDYDKGIYAIIVAKDGAGKETKVQVKNIYLDTTVPVLAVTPPASNYPNWVKESIDTVLTAKKPNGAAIAGIEIAEVKDISNTANVPADAWTAVSIGTGRNVSYQNKNLAQDSGIHYLHVKVNNGIDTEPLVYVFGPYKVDLINPEVAAIDLNMSHPNSARWVEQSNRRGWYWEDVQYKVNTKDDGGSKIAERKYQITNSPTLLPVNGSGWINRPWAAPSDNVMLVDVVNNGLNYIHTYLKDAAGNENLTNNRNSTAIRIDHENPVLDLDETFIGTVRDGVLYGYASYRLKASDITSGVRQVKYAVTDNPNPPALNVDGSVDPADFGRTGGGWVDITEPAIASDGYVFDVKAVGFNYIHVYVEDNAGRGLHTVPANVLSEEPINTTETVNPGVEFKPSYLIGLTVVDEDGSLILDHDTQGIPSHDNIYALRNISSWAIFKLDYHNYDNTTTKLEIDIIDKKTNTVVRTSKDVVKLNVGLTTDGTADPYTKQFYFMDESGQMLDSGLYELKAKLYVDDVVISTVSTYVVLKQNTLQNPVITDEVTGTHTDVAITYTADDFLQNLADTYRADRFIYNFIAGLAADNPTEYSSTAMTSGSPKEYIEHSPVFVDNAWSYETDVTKQTTFVAQVKDAFGNEASVTKVVYFTGTSYEPDDPVVDDDVVGDDGGDATVIGSSVKNIETPSADNYFIGFKETTNDTLKENVFDFLGNHE